MAMPDSLRRARTLDELDALGKKFRTKEGYEAGLSFQPRPTDILISPHAKSGTTWLQHIAHGLRTRGSMDFEEINQIAPWIELAYDFGWDLETDHVAEPRVFKSHLDWYKIPKGGRYICSVRNPYDVMVSYYRFFEGWWFEVGSISLDDFTRSDPLESPDEWGYWHHLISWWEQRENKDVLLLCYEDMVADLPSTVRRVAAFMDIDLDDELYEIVLRQSTREFMLAHKSHFDEHLIRQYFARRGGAPADGEGAKVTSGAPDDERYKLSAELKGELDTIWRKMIYPRFGFEDYAALRKAIAALPRL